MSTAYLRLDLSTGQISTFAGNGQKGYSGDGGPATKAQLNEPYEVRFDSSGNIRRKAATVFGAASSSKLARKSNPPAVTSSMARP